MTPNKRPYTLSEAALRQRKEASAAKLRKRALSPENLARFTMAIPPHVWNESGDIHTMFPALPKDAPMSAHQSRASQIRNHKLRTGQITGTARGGRKSIPTKCSRCGNMCNSSREAWNHCLTPRTPKA